MNKHTAFCVVLVVSVVLSMTAVSPQAAFAQATDGMNLFNSWKFQEAEKAFREALKSDPKDIRTSYYLGLSVLMQDKHSEALDILLNVKEALDKTEPKVRPAVPDEFQIQIALARAHLELKKNTEAWKNLEAAKKLHPESAEVCVYRGLYYLNQNDNKKAIKELEKAMDLDGKEAYAHYYAGHAYLRSGNPEKAVEMFKTFMQLAPQAPEAEKAKALIFGLC
jgi:tetratricopeptide (TPR) repeat protein